MEILSAVLVTILLMLGLMVFTFKKAADAVALDAKAYYDRVGRIWLFGGLIQWKIRKFYEEFGEKVFKKETPEEKKKVVEKHTRLRYGTDAQRKDRRESEM